MAESEFQDLIIVKRRLNTEPEMPKGGVWKIAFADFMTAMMCFFLVMWLINAANEDTRKAVASYFNPIRLAELNRKGVQDPHYEEVTPSENGERTTEESTPGEAAPAEPSADIPRDALFKDPYKVLSQIAAKAGPVGAEGSAGGADAQGPGTASVFRDLFDPEFRQSLGDAAKSEVESAPLETVGEDTPTGRQRHSTPDADPPEGALAMSQKPGIPQPAAVAMPTLRPAEPESTAEADRSKLQVALSEAVGTQSGSSHSPNVAVEQTSDGVMISLTDDADFGMFGIGSAEPQPQTVRIMERIAEVLRTRGGSITIRGHTDARPFRSADYDNWRLSTDRAQMAYYMLVRGGLDEKRVDAIEGYADRKLKVSANPEAAENRRIEILLREASS